MGANLLHILENVYRTVRYRTISDYYMEYNIV
jgi:hypothetical protein